MHDDTCPVNSSTNSTSRIVPTGNCKLKLARMNVHGGFMFHDSTLLRCNHIYIDAVTVIIKILVKLLFSNKAVSQKSDA